MPRPAIMLPTWHPGSRRMMAGLTGVLTGGQSVGGRYCIWIAASHDGARVPVVWPAGYTARFHPLELLNEVGEIVARGGDEIAVSGGFLPSNPHGICSFGFDHAFHVNSPVRRAAEVRAQRYDRRPDEH